MIIELIYFFNELDLLDLRLHELNDVVDKHIIIEYPTDYAGKPRTMYYSENKERFRKFDDKIIHVVDTDTYSGIKGIELFWKRKGSPLLMETLSSLSNPDDFIMPLDGDVIIKANVLKNLDKSKQTILRTRWCQYFMNVYCPDVGYDWSFGVPYHILLEAGNLHKMVHHHSPGLQLSENSGWHFTKLGGVDKIIENTIGYPHQEYSNPALLDRRRIQERIDNLWSWDDTQQGKGKNAWRWVIDPLDKTQYPGYISDRWDIYSQYFKEPK